MQWLSQVDKVSAHFRERKELAILEEPLEMTGILRYRAPDYVKKQVILPYRESFEVQGDRLFIDTPEAGQRQLSLPGYPALHAFVESFRATLAGDLGGLERYYRVRLDGEATAWRLRLEPLDQEMAQYVTAIIIRGSNDQVLSIETLETGGDRSLMTIRPIHE